MRWIPILALVYLMIGAFLAEVLKTYHYPRVERVMNRWPRAFPVLLALYGVVVHAAWPLWVPFAIMRRRET